jgi:UDP-N-acetylglucosamine 2-epimerase (non-hydrolysing)
VRVATIVGTRPEAIKLAPVIRGFAGTPGCRSVVIATAQHREMLDQVLRLFEIVPAHDLDLMRPNQTLGDLASRSVAALARVIELEQPDLVVVQGDTTTAVMGALAAGYARRPVAHVEAGLRSFDKANPFPEELNRRMLTQLADLHFAPTEGNRRNLVAEGVPSERIHVTGNPVIDALLHVAGMVNGDHLERLLPGADAEARRLVLVTAHRRESFGPPLEGICAAIQRLTEANSDVLVVYPVHPNPNVRRVVEARLAGRRGVRLLEPVGYFDFVALMKSSSLILTDSGGVQEEAPSLGKPVLVLREVTERPEAVAAGTVRLVGRDPERIVAAASELLSDEAAYRAMARCVNPYGDGQATGRIVEAARAYVAARPQ